MNKRCMGCMEQYDSGLEICPYCGYVEGTGAEEAIHMAPGSILLDRYIIGRVLGYGGFGVTYIAWDGKLEQKVAIKEYLPSEFSTRIPGQSCVTLLGGEKNEQFRDGLKKFVEEAKRLAKFQNESGIVKVFDSFTENETAYIIMEYLEGETLSDRLKRDKVIPEDEAVSMLMPVMRSLETVHKEGILHRDIAPDNIFLTTNGQVKLIDFGASRYATTSHSKSLTTIIKPGYSPKEQYDSRGDQGPHTDVYALAGTLYKMITGVTPPEAMGRNAECETRKRDPLMPLHKYCKSISQKRENAILNALNIRIEDRTPDVASFMKELDSEPPAKRRYGKIKKIDLYHWPVWLKVGIPALMAVVITFGALLATGVINFPSLFTEEIVIPDGIVSVPDVEGLSKDEAIRLIEEANLTASSEGSIESKYIDAGVIVLQTPTGSSYLEENGIVTLMISSGNGVVKEENGVCTVPYVIWDDKKTALSKLKEAGFDKPVIEEKNDDNVAAGKVISQSIEAGEKVEKGTTVTIVISKGSKSMKMPNVKGMTYSEAEKTLKAMGLVVAAQYEKNDSVPENTVLKQSVKDGDNVSKGTKITLTVSSKNNTLKVPYLTGVDKASAVSQLEKLGFKVTILEGESDAPENTVYAQSPLPGSEQKSGTSVIIYVCTASNEPSLVKVGNVTGNKENEAISTLEKAGFSVSVSKEYSDNVAEGVVIRQEPAADTEKNYGSKVVIYISRGVQTLTVNNVVGKKRSEAENTLKKTGFAVEIKESFNSAVAPGKVIKQSPPADEKLKKGGKVTIYVSKGKQKFDVATVYGMTEDEARKALAKFDVSVVYDGYSTDIPYGSVLSQEPAGATSLEEGSVIRLTLSKGPDWSDYTDTLPSEVTSDEYEITEQTRYSYRDKQTTTSNDSSKDGWTQYDSSWAWSEYGSWSGWSSSWVGSDDSRQVETKTVTDKEAYTEYTYNRVVDKKNGCSKKGFVYFCINAAKYNYKSHNGHFQKETYTTRNRLSANTAFNKEKYFCNCGEHPYYITGYLTSSGDKWYNETSKYYPAVTHTEYRYRERRKIYTYYYYRWDDWSDYSENEVSQSSDRDVRTKTYYSYRRK